METTLWAFAICLAFAIPIVWIGYKARHHEPLRQMLGIAVIRDQDDVAIRRAVSEACKGLPVKALSIEDAEGLIEETARHAVAKQLANANPGRAYAVTPHWPWAKCVISGNIAVVRVILGHDFMGDHDGLRAVNFEINRESNVLNLRPWAPKQPEPAPDGRPEGKTIAARQPPKTESISKPKPARANMRKS